MIFHISGLPLRIERVGRGDWTQAAQGMEPMVSSQYPSYSVGDLSHLDLGHEYNLYPFPCLDDYGTFCDPHKMPEVNAFTHVHNWIKFLQLQYYDGKVLIPHFPLFPSFNLHNICWGVTLSTASVNDLLALYAKEAGLNASGFTSHCFQHGGVQYWLLHAPITECWSLEKCHWWGGWAAGEDVSASLYYQHKTQ
jgi:hypothetical protein